jgi:HAD superfamily hydrolase (TIGR01509 family)
MTASCVVLDIGGVLVSTPERTWPGPWEARAGLAPGTTLSRIDDVARAGSLGHLTEAEVVAAVAERLPEAADHLDAFWDELWTEYLGTLNAGVDAWFRALRPRYRTGILSNSFVGAREREQERYGFGDAADVLVYSHEVGLAKPDPAVYALTAERLGARPAEIVFVDDTPECVEGARAAGWHGVLFVTERQVIGDVTALLG